MSSDQIVGAITTAAQAWMAADPVAQLVYDGTTTANPDAPTGLNYNNVFGFEPLPSNCTDGLACADVPSSPACNSFDIVLKADAGFAWNPCTPQDGQSCWDGSTADGYDLADVSTHEWGHVLDLAHANGGQNPADDQLTMAGAAIAAVRHQDTLGLGDVLGERHLYPTSAPMPTLFNP